MKSFPLTRRRFLGTSVGAAGALAFPMFIPSRAFGANDRIQVAAIGVGGKGAVDIQGTHNAGGEIAFLCDVDDRQGAEMYKTFASAKRYKDFRQMLQKEEKSIDAVIVSTPDHTHAPAALMAMRMGKHVYCQKPLTHTVHEARLMTEVAREKKVATQMGNQGHSDPDTRRLVELIRSGVLGKVREAHVWTDRPIWPQGIDRPVYVEEREPEEPDAPEAADGADGAEKEKAADAPAAPKKPRPKREPKLVLPTMPDGLDWDLWLGPAPERPYHPAYVPFKWRGFWDFGTGALGDMACHCMDVVFFALELPAPTSIQAESSGINAETAPTWSIIRYQFPSLKMTWYDGRKKPPADLVKGRRLAENGVILVGDKDTLYIPSYWGPGQFLSGAKMEDFKDVAETLPRAPMKFDDGHYAEWINAARGGPAAMSNFDYAGPMTEAVLLGNVALRTGPQKLEWDSKNLRVTNVAEANRFIRKPYRKGWEIEAGRA